MFIGFKKGFLLKEESKDRNDLEKDIKCYETVSVTKIDSETVIFPWDIHSEDNQNNFDEENDIEIKEEPYLKSIQQNPISLFYQSNVSFTMQLPKKKKLKGIYSGTVGDSFLPEKIGSFSFKDNNHTINYEGHWYNGVWNGKGNLEETVSCEQLDVSVHIPQGYFKEGCLMLEGGFSGDSHVFIKKVSSDSSGRQSLEIHLYGVMLENSNYGIRSLKDTYLCNRFSFYSGEDSNAKLGKTTQDAMKEEQSVIGSLFESTQQNSQTIEISDFDLIEQKIEKFLEKISSDYIKEMRKPKGLRGGDIEIAAISEILGVNITIHLMHDQKPNQFKINQSWKTIHILYNGIHYNVCDESGKCIKVVPGDNDCLFHSCIEGTKLQGHTVNLSYPIIEQHAKNMSFDWEDVGGGGNCLFLSIAHQLKERNIDTKIDHIKVRKKVADYIYSHWNEYKEFITDLDLEDAGLGKDKEAVSLTNTEKEKYINYLKKDGTWGDNISIKAAAKVFRVNIIVKSKLSTDYDVNESIDGATNTIYIGHIAELHYQSLFLKQKNLTEHEEILKTVDTKCDTTEKLRKQVCDYLQKEVDKLEEEAKQLQDSLRKKEIPPSEAEYYIRKYKKQNNKIRSRFETLIRQDQNENDFAEYLPACKLREEAEKLRELCRESQLNQLKKQSEKSHIDHNAMSLSQEKTDRKTQTLNQDKANSKIQQTVNKSTKDVKKEEPKKHFKRIGQIQVISITEEQNFEVIGYWKDNKIQQIQSRTVEIYKNDFEIKRNELIENIKQKINNSILKCEEYYNYLLFTFCFKILTNSSDLIKFLDNLAIEEEEVVSKQIKNDAVRLKKTVLLEKEVSEFIAINNDDKTVQEISKSLKEYIKGKYFTWLAESDEYDIESLDKIKDNIELVLFIDSNILKMIYRIRKLIKDYWNISPKFNLDKELSEAECKDEGLRTIKNALIYSWGKYLCSTLEAKRELHPFYNFINENKIYDAGWNSFKEKVNIIKTASDLYEECFKNCISILINKKSASKILGKEQLFQAYQKFYYNYLFIVLRRKFHLIEGKIVNYQEKHEEAIKSTIKDFITRYVDSIQNRTIKSKLIKLFGEENKHLFKVDYVLNIMDFSLKIKKILDVDNINIQATSKGYHVDNNQCDNKQHGFFEVKVRESSIYTSADKKDKHNNTHRGLHFVVMDQSGTKKKDQVFDTHKLDKNQEIIEFIDKVDELDIIAMGVCDEGSKKLSNDVKEKLKKLGSSQIDRVGYRHSWSFIVQKGNNDVIGEFLAQDTKEAAVTKVSISNNVIVKSLTKVIEQQIDILSSTGTLAKDIIKREMDVFYKFLEVYIDTYTFLQEKIGSIINFIDDTLTGIRDSVLYHYSFILKRVQSHVDEKTITNVCDFIEKQTSFLGNIKNLPLFFKENICNIVPYDERGSQGVCKISIDKVKEFIQQYARLPSTPEYFSYKILQYALNILTKISEEQHSFKDQLNIYDKYYDLLGELIKQLDKQIDCNDLYQYKDEKQALFEACSKIKNIERLSTYLSVLKQKFAIQGNQIEIFHEKAIELFMQLNELDVHSKETLNKLYKRYQEKFNRFEQLYLTKVINIKAIIEHLEDIVRQDVIEQKSDSLMRTSSSFLSRMVEIIQKEKAVSYKSKDARENFLTLLAGLSWILTVRVSHLDDDSTGKYKGDLSIQLSPHVIQILGCIQFLALHQDIDEKNMKKWLSKVPKQVGEILTGQGKSWQILLLSMMYALCGYDVIVACYSDYLSNRDKKDFDEKFKRIYKQIDKIQYKTLKKLASDEIENNYEETIGSIVEQIIYNQEYNGSIKLKEFNSSEGCILIVDEIDTLISSELGNGAFRIVNVYSNHLAEAVNGLYVAAKKQEIIDKSSSADQFVEKAKKDPKIANLNSMLFEQYKSSIIKCINVVTDYYSDNPQRKTKGKEVLSKEGFLMDEEKLRFRLNEHGCVQYYNKQNQWDSNEFCGYYNVAFYLALFEQQHKIEKKEYKEYGYLQLKCGNIYYSAVIKKMAERNNRQQLLGVTGSIKQRESQDGMLCLADALLSNAEKGILKDFLGIKEENICYFPSFYGRMRVTFDPTKPEYFIVTNNEKAWQEKIISESITLSEQGKSVLVFFKDIWMIDKVFDRLMIQQKGPYKLTNDVISINENGIRQSNKDSYNIIEDSYKKEKLTPEEWQNSINRLISEHCAGKEGQISLIISNYGRGTDFKCSDAANKNGGLHVIQTWFSEDPKEEVQVRGRTARNGAPGVYKQILCLEHLKKGTFYRANVDDITVETTYVQLRDKAKLSVNKRYLDLKTQIEQKNAESTQALTWLHDARADRNKKLKEKAPNNINDEIVQRYYKKICKLNL